MQCSRTCLLLFTMCQIRERVPRESDEEFSGWSTFLFQNSLGGICGTMMGVVEQETWCIQIIHFGIADSPRWPPVPFLLSAVMILHLQTLSRVEIILKLFKIFAFTFYSSLSWKVTLIAQTSLFNVLASKLRLKRLKI